MNIGQRIGDYEIIEVLGQGGMGQVYKVKNLVSERIEAMKVLLPNIEGDSELAERFQRVIKMLDFGIARVKTDSKLTKPGSTLGSLYYMSPEQIQGAEPDPRSDLYSVGIVLYEMVTGKRPFLGDTDYSIMAGHLQQVPVPPVQLVPWTLGPL